MSDPTNKKAPASDKQHDKKTDKEEGEASKKQPEIVELDNATLEEIVGGKTVADEGNMNCGCG